MRRLKLFLPIALSSVLFCSCINGDYDLSNIDTTARISANNLKVPLNMDAITLDKVINPSEDGMIKEMVDPETGKTIYAISEGGTFLSSAIQVPSFAAEKPNIDPIQSDIDMEVLLQTPFDELNKYIQELKNQGIYDPSKEKEYEQTVWNNIKGDLEAQGEPLCRYTFDSKKTSFSTDSKTVDKNVRGVDRILCDADVMVNIDVPQLAGLVNVPLKELILLLPKGLTLTANHGTYDSATGLFDLSNDAPVIKNGVASFNGEETNLKIHISAIDAKVAGIELITKEDAEGTLSVSGDIQVVSGRIYVECDDFVNSHTIYDLPRVELHYDCSPDMSEIKVTHFTGRLKYDIKDVNIDPIALHDLPDILNDDNTNVVLGNPQIYIKVTNPLAQYNVKAQAGFQFCGEREGVKRSAYSLDDGVLTIVKSPSTFCLSPTKPKAYYGDFSNAEYARFTGLKNILSGGGLPDKIVVDVQNPCIPEQQVVDFELGMEVDKVEGEYTFFAPLSLSEGSVIVYEKTDNDWDADVLQKLVVESLKVTAKVTSQIPLGATLTLSPLGKDGKEISGVTFTCNKLEAYAQNQDVEFVQTGGVIRNLDGIRLRATIVADKADEALAPVQSLDLKNVRVTVSGYYEDEL